MFQFKLPDLGEGVHEAEVLKWHVKPGETIAEDAPLLDVETDKAAVTIPSPKGGVVVKLFGKVGAVIHVGDVLAEIDDGLAAGAAEETAAAPTTAIASAPMVEPPPAVVASRAKQGPVPAAPATRRLARELGVNINQIGGSGPAGRVLDEDVRRFAAGGAPTAETPMPPTPVASPTAPPASPRAEEPRAAASGGAGIPYLDLDPLPDYAALGPVEKIPLRSIRRKVARKMVTAKILAPHVCHMDEADITEMDALRRRIRDKRRGQPGGRLTMLALTIKAAAALLPKYPFFNASVDAERDEVVYKKFYNIGFAVDTSEGLKVAVIKDADRKSLLAVSEEIATLAEQARAGAIDAEHLRGSTFTVSNIGAMGGTMMIPAINFPETAILGMARADDKPVVRDGAVVARKMLPLVLAFDHRVADGGDAARFVGELIGMLTDPERFMLGE